MNDFNESTDNMEEVGTIKKCSNKACDDPVKLIDAFPKNKSSKDGHSHWCRACHKAYRDSKSKRSGVVEASEELQEV